MGPLAGIRVLEIAGLGPAPFAGMMLSDMGAELLRVDRTENAGTMGFGDPSFDFLNRGRRNAAVDLKSRDGTALMLRLVERADVLIEGFRPGVMERLGLGPEVCHERNPALVYGRMTGWGREGPLAQRAGHDINYISVAGSLAPIGRKGQPPTPPLNFVGDFGGGGMFLAFGIVSALVERQRSGLGQVVDAAMVDGAAVLATPIHGAQQFGMWSDEAGTNLLDSGAPFYEVYETADRKYVSVGAIEPQFYATLLDRMGLAGDELPPQMERDSWPAMKERFAEVFRSKTRDEWCEVMEGVDACFSPVLTMGEARSYRHNLERGTFVSVGERVHPAPAPRFSRSAPEIASPPSRSGSDTDEALADWGIEAGELQRLHDIKVIA